VRNPPKLAIWDIDGTLARPSLERQFVALLLRERWLRPAQLAGRALRLCLRLPPPHAFQIKLAYVRGETVAQVAEWVESWWSGHGQLCLLPGASRAVRYFQEHGVKLVLLSGTVDFLANRVAQHFGIEHVVAGRAQIRDGKYTGSLEAPHPHGRFKLDYATLWLKQHSLDWRDALALGDHEGDLALLSRAGRAVAVNPRPALRAEALQRGWLVVTDDQLPGALLDWI
jgi:HAD superfamily hydrolase (TIGR01490 family)